MGLFDQFFGTSSTNLHPDWKSLESMDALAEIVADRSDAIFVLFKHSTRCGVSGTILHRLIREWPFQAGEVNFYYLDLIRYRDISNAIAQQLQVQHESPQIIVLKNGQVVFDASHYQIDAEVLKEKIR